MRVDCNEGAFHRSYSQDLVEYGWQPEAEAGSAGGWLAFASLLNVTCGVLLLVKPW